jgi:hypothetical protein
MVWLSIVELLNTYIGAATSCAFFLCSDCYVITLHLTGPHPQLDRAVGGDRALLGLKQLDTEKMKIVHNPKIKK